MWTGISWNKRYPFAHTISNRTECSSILSLSSGKSSKIPLHFTFRNFSQNWAAFFRIKSGHKLLDTGKGIPWCNIREYLYLIPLLCRLYKYIIKRRTLRKSAGGTLPAAPAWAGAALFCLTACSRWKRERKDCEKENRKKAKKMEKSVDNGTGVWYYTWAPSAETKEWLLKPQQEALEKNQ